MARVSIITSCHNAEKFVGKAIESVRRQTFEAWEHIVVDDGSTDDSAQVVAAYATIEPRLRLIRQSQGGMCNARNNGFKVCSPETEYVHFFDADDCLEPQMLDVMVGYLDEHPSVGVAYCDHVNMDAADRVYDRNYSFNRYVPSRFGIRTLPYDLPETPLVALAGGLGASLDGRSIFRRRLYEKTSGWDEELGRGGQVLDLFEQFALLGDVHFVAQKLHQYRLHDSGQSHLTVNREAQAHKILDKWKRGDGLGRDEKARVAELVWFYERRLRPHIEMKAGMELMLDGKIRFALKHFVGAGKKYVMSFLPFSH